MTLAQRYDIVLSSLREEYGISDTELNFSTPFELLVATVLSAQCTDKRVNIVTDSLFLKYDTPEKMAEATEDKLFEYIKSVSYPRSKSRYLFNISHILRDKFAGKVPQTLDELTSLPGVGRKTANVVMAFAFGASTLAVDTHVFRVSHRLRLVPARCTTPLSVEQYLLRHIPKEKIPGAHSQLLLHGRYVCQARKPKCEICKFTQFCPSYKKVQDKV